MRVLILLFLHMQFYTNLKIHYKHWYINTILIFYIYFFLFSNSLFSKHVNSFLFYLVDSSIPKWSSSYSVEGDIFIPFAEVHEPFNAWYDSESSNSRIDYYNGNLLLYYC